MDRETRSRSIFILASIPTIAYLLGMLLTGDVGGVINLVLIPVGNLILGAITTFLFVAPVDRFIAWTGKPDTTFSSINIRVLAGIMLALFLTPTLLGYFYTISLIISGVEVDETIFLKLFRFLFCGGTTTLLAGPVYFGVRVFRNEPSDVG